MRILVTRPLPDAETTAADLRERGHEPVLAPMLEICFIDWSEASAPTARPLDAIVATSPNGVRGLLGHPEINRLRRLRLFVAGDASARLAETSGFINVVSARGGMAEVAACIATHLSPASSLLYAAGRDRSGDLAGDLITSGFRVDLVEVYRAIAVSHLPESVLADLRAGQIDRILIFSARTARTLVAALTDAGLLALSRTIQIHAISQQAAEPLISAGFSSVITAFRPDAAELLDTLESSR